MITVTLRNEGSDYHQGGITQYAPTTSLTCYFFKKNVWKYDKLLESYRAQRYAYEELKS